MESPMWEQTTAVLYSLSLKHISLISTLGAHKIIFVFGWELIMKSIVILFCSSFFTILGGIPDINAAAKAVLQDWNR